MLALKWHQDNTCDHVCGDTRPISRAVRAIVRRWGSPRLQRRSAHTPRRSLAASWVPEVATLPPPETHLHRRLLHDHSLRHVGRRRRAQPGHLRQDITCAFMPWVTIIASRAVAAAGEGTTAVGGKPTFGDPMVNGVVAPIPNFPAA
jgi:hypothetical protein